VAPTGDFMVRFIHGRGGNKFYVMLGQKYSLY